MKTKTGATFITPVIYSGVAFDGLIASHGRPHVAVVSFSVRKAKIVFLFKIRSKITSF